MINTSYFFVTGLPRSRTAWAALWLTTDKSHCFHDEGSQKLFEPTPELLLKQHLGVSGPELVFEHKAIQTKLGYSPWLVIERKPDDAFQAFRKVAGHHLPADGPALRQAWKQRLLAYADLLMQQNVLAVRMEDLDDLSTAKLVWNHLLPGVGFERPRWELLRQMNVQQKFEQVLKEKVESWPSLAPSAP